jgi:glycosyltransferase involved in cell wall biosynthesis
VEAVHRRIGAGVLRTADLVHIHDGRYADHAVRVAPTAEIVVAEHPALPCPACSAAPAPVRSSQLVWFGRHRHYRGVDLLCRALATYWDGGGHRSAMFVSPDPAPRSLRTLVQRYPGRAVTIRRWLSPVELHDLLTSSSVCVMPYRRGTQSAMPWWAVRHGCHLLATDVGAIGDTARRIGGTVVTPNSVPALIDGLRQLESAVGPPQVVQVPTFDELAGALIQSWRRVR